MLRKRTVPHILNTNGIFFKKKDSFVLKLVEFLDSRTKRYEKPTTYALRLLIS